MTADRPFNSMGAMTSRTDALNRTTNYTLDAWNRVTTATYPDSSTHTFGYDANSNLTGWTDGIGTWARTYDADNRMTAETLGGSTIASWSYDATGKKGLLGTETDSNGRVNTLGYDSNGRTTSVAESTNGTAYWSWNENSQLSSFTQEGVGGNVENWVYDDAGRIDSVTANKATTTVLDSYSYSFNADDQITGWSEHNGAVVTTGYDSQHHLTSESRTVDGPYSFSYGVDGVANRTSKTNGTTSAYGRSVDDELTTLGGTTLFGYNANGEQTSRVYGGTTYSLAYDYDGNLTSISHSGITDAAYVYDALGRRYSRTAGGVTTTFQYGQFGILLEKQGSTTVGTYCWGPTLVRRNSEYPFFDALGNVRLILNVGTGNVSAAVSYDQFGNVDTWTGSSSLPYLWHANSGYRNDNDCGLLVVGARYYDPAVGQFITRDSLIDQLPYAYCGHDPANHVDPSGHIIAATIVYGVATALVVPGLVSLASDINEVRINNDAYGDMLRRVKAWRPKTEAGQQYKDRLLSGDLIKGNISANIKPAQGAIGSMFVIGIGLATPSVSKGILDVGAGE